MALEVSPQGQVSRTSPQSSGSGISPQVVIVRVSPRALRVKSHVSGSVAVCGENVNHTHETFNDNAPAPGSHQRALRREEFHDRLDRVNFIPLVVARLRSG